MTRLSTCRISRAVGKTRAIPDVPPSEFKKSPIIEKCAPASRPTHYRNVSCGDESDVESSDGSEGDEIEFVTELRGSVASQWTGRKLRMADGSQAFIIDADECAWKSGSKEAFIRLLEGVEECLGCATVFVTAKRNQEHLALMMKTFMYLGFRVVAPTEAPVDVASVVCLAIDL